LVAVSVLGWKVRTNARSFEQVEAAIAVLLSGEAEELVTSTDHSANQIASAPIFDQAMPLPMPNPALLDVLLPAYAPCQHLPGRGGSCREAVWQPQRGYIPCGFLGATGELHEVRVVMVFAEPAILTRTRTSIR